MLSGYVNNHRKMRTKKNFACMLAVSQPSSVSSTLNRSFAKFSGFVFFVRSLVGRFCLYDCLCLPKCLCITTNWRYWSVLLSDDRMAWLFMLFFCNKKAIVILFHYNSSMGIWISNKWCVLFKVHCLSDRLNTFIWLISIFSPDFGSSPFIEM